MDLHHSHEVLCEVIFPSEHLNIRSCVNSLKGSNLADALALNRHVAPVDVPVSVLILNKFHVHLAGNAFNHIVPAWLDAEHQFLPVCCACFFFLIHFLSLCFCISWLFVFRLTGWLLVFLVGCVSYEILLIQSGDLACKVCRALAIIGCSYLTMFWHNL